MVLLDTCVVAEIQKVDGSQRIKDAVQRHLPEDVFLSVITIGALRNGISMLAPGQKRTALDVWFIGLQNEYSDRILPVTVDVARDWGKLAARVRANGNTLAPADGLIVATASRHGLTMMTRNTKHLAPAGMPLIDPWDEDGVAG